MSREIKFRAFMQTSNTMLDAVTLTEMRVLNCGYGLSEDAILEQFTGLHDCKRTEEYPNGQPIYEGDVVRVVYDGEEYVYQVVFDISELDFKATNGEENYGRNFQYLTCCEEVEVIGNIHERSE